MSITLATHGLFGGSVDIATRGLINTKREPVKWVSSQTTVVNVINSARWFE